MWLYKDKFQNRCWCCGFQPRTGEVLRSRPTMRKHLGTRCAGRYCALRLSVRGRVKLNLDDMAYR